MSRQASEYTRMDSNYHNQLSGFKADEIISPAKFTPVEPDRKIGCSKRRKAEDVAFQLIEHLEFSVVHEVPGRVRLRPRLPFSGADIMQAALAVLARRLAGTDITISPRTGSILAYYADPDARERLLLVFSSPENGGRKVKEFAGSSGSSGHAVLPPFDLRVAPATDRGRAGAVNKDETEPEVKNPVPFKILSTVLPNFVTALISAWRAIPYLWTGLKMILRGRINLEALDGAALTLCIARRDFRSLSSIVFFFSLGEYLAEWTRKKSRASLADSLALNIDKVWVRKDGLEYQVPMAGVSAGDIVVVRAGSIMPVDGTVIEGDGMVNQATMTGEALPVSRSKGSTAYAGTVLEQGELAVEVARVGGETRINSILRAIEESEGVKASIQGKYERVADAIVPYNFLLSGAVYAATRDPVRAGSVLLVDYSCAIRLATPLTIFTAMREAAEHGVLIKGGKFMEAAAEADVIVFDKTGTLTEARPVVVDVIPFGGRERSMVLRLAACLEEHFVHPVGQAVVRAAEAENLKHREEHTQVEFLVAHGIASRWNGRRVLIGSEHFILEDENIGISPDQAKIVEKQTSKGRSALYLAIGEELAGILLIEDKMREDAPAVIEALRRDGLKRVIMLTGDGHLTAESIAAKAGITEFKSRMLPEDKADFVESLKQQGHKIIMVGDGINDSPALSAANVGVAMAEGADMAREVADIVLVSGQLRGLLLARIISRLALRRVRKNFQVSLFWNSIFLAGGLLGALGPGLSAFMHNATTAAIAVSAVQPLLPILEDPEIQAQGNAD